MIVVTLSIKTHDSMFFPFKIDKIIPNIIPSRVSVTLSEITMKTNTNFQNETIKILYSLLLNIS